MNNIDLSTISYGLASVLFLIGIYGILVPTHLLRKLIGMNVMQVAVIAFFVLLAYKDGAAPPIAHHDELIPNVSEYINPLPHTLMLTAIVVAVSTTGVALSLLIRIHRRFGTLNEEELLEKFK